VESRPWLATRTHKPRRVLSMRSPVLALLLCAAAFSVLAGGKHATNAAALRAAKNAAEAAEPAPYLAREAFMQGADVRDVSMSPDGHWLVFRRRAGQRLELRVREIAGSREALVMAESEDSEVYWSGDGARLWLPDAKGVGIFDVATQTGRRIFRFDASRRQTFWQVDRNAPDYAVLREKVVTHGEWRYRYLALDASGETRLIHESGMALRSLLLDADGEPRFSSGYDGEQFDTVIWRHGRDGRQALMRCPLPRQCRPVAYSDNLVWALAHDGEDLLALQRFDAMSRQWQTLHRDPRGIADAVSLLMEPEGDDWLAIAYRPDRVEWYGRTDAADAALAAIAAALPDANLDIRPANNGQRWFVRAAKSNWQHDRYFLFDVPGQSLQAVFATERRGSIPSSELADMLPVHWRGRDGLALHGYAFLPRGIALETAPIIVFIHGGPYGRALGEGDPGTQLMVNRGYIVFKPNFRASTGYGVNHVTAARGDFGKTGVLDDIVTGLDYLIANGIGDAGQQAVAGHSFGGYASLLAVTHYPDRFAFAVPSAAPVDMAWSMADIAIEGGSALSADGPPMDVLLPNFGVPYAEQAWHERMHRESPLAHAAQLRTPVYLWAGANDDRVALESIVRYVADAAPDYRPALLIDPDSGHNPHERLNVEALAWLIEHAAGKHFGGAVTPPSPPLRAFLEKNALSLLDVDPALGRQTPRLQRLTASRDVSS